MEGNYISTYLTPPRLSLHLIIPLITLMILTKAQIGILDVVLLKSKKKKNTISKINTCIYYHIIKDIYLNIIFRLSKQVRILKDI